MKFEQRIMSETLDVELRDIESATAGAVVEGYAARFGVLSMNLGGFKEIILPGSFRSALQDEEIDVVALFNHDQNHVLGRQSAGTLKVWEDKRGLRYRIDLGVDDMPLARKMQRGDIKNSSFRFMVAQNGSEWSERDGMAIRSIKGVSKLIDVGPVTFPAYPDADSGVVRSAVECRAAIEERDRVMGARRREQAAKARAWLMKEGLE